jgi:hypothetical protein
MARIKYTALVESIRGSIQGTTFQRNAYGYTVKGKPNMVNPNTLLQVYSKQSFSFITKQWRALTETNRSQWEAYAASFPIPARLNPDSNLNGFNYFVKYHSIRNQDGVNFILSNPGNTQETIDFEGGDLILGGGAIAYEGSASNSGGTWRIYLYSTQAIPFGQEYIRNTPKFINYDAISPSFSVDMTAQFTALYGQLPAVGEWLGLKVILIRTDNAQMIEFTPFQQEIIP